MRKKKIRFRWACWAGSFISIFHKIGGPVSMGLSVFFIFIFKKTKFQKYMPNREIFKKWVPVAPLMGDRVPVAHPVGDRT